ncbi:hypothetical protein BKA62DRAFT_5546 [Auriculariales sp. MPI-PUGE-AT-0066]|nr:hypothetical protein BKA62DRAFT_5546 [Auriculariales sp. MPI-PUGE-AT-0066]
MRVARTVHVALSLPIRHPVPSNSCWPKKSFFSSRGARVACFTTGPPSGHKVIPQAYFDAIEGKKTLETALEAIAVVRSSGDVPSAQYALCEHLLKTYRAWRPRDIDMILDLLPLDRPGPDAKLLALAARLAFDEGGFIVNPDAPLTPDHNNNWTETLSPPRSIQGLRDSFSILDRAIASASRNLSEGNTAPDLLSILVQHAAIPDRMNRIEYLLEAVADQEWKERYMPMFLASSYHQLCLQLPNNLEFRALSSRTSTKLQYSANIALNHAFPDFFVMPVSLFATYFVEPTVSCEVARQLINRHLIIAHRRFLNAVSPFSRGMAAQTQPEANYLRRLVQEVGSFALEATARYDIMSLDRKKGSILPTLSRLHRAAMQYKELGEILAVQETPRNDCELQFINVMRNGSKINRLYA